MIEPRYISAKLIAGFIVLTITSALAEPRVLINAGGAIEGVMTDIRYAGTANFLGRSAKGYGKALCLLTPEATEALFRAQDFAKDEGMALLIYDCYRPQRAVDDFVNWVNSHEEEPTKAIYYPHIPRGELIQQGYIAERSGHSRGSTVDLTLVSTETGETLNMGTPWDFFDERSHTQSNLVSADARANRHTLKRIMEGAGFRGYFAEWWHFSLVNEPFPNTYFDIPIE
jgi:D-alanyl-D-alanine dipeptidase